MILQFAQRALALAFHPGIDDETLSPDLSLERVLYRQGSSVVMEVARIGRADK